MKVIGNLVKEKEMEFIFHLLAIGMKDLGRTIRSMVMGNTIL